MKRCPQCGRAVASHPNKRFCRAVCKDRFHNAHNPRGYGLLRPERDSWDEYADTIHPFSQEAFEQ